MREEIVKACGDISIAVTKCEEICLAVKKGARRRWRVLCKPEKEEVTGGLGRGACKGLKCKTRITGWRSGLLLLLTNHHCLWWQAPQKLRSTCISQSKRKANLNTKSLHALAEIGWRHWRNL